MNFIKANIYIERAVSGKMLYTYRLIHIYILFIYEIYIYAICMTNIHIYNIYMYTYI